MKTATKTPRNLQEALLPELIRPSYVKNEFDSIQVNSNHNRIICAVGYPRMIKEGWLNNIISSEGEFDLSMFVEPKRIEGLLSDLNNELVKQKSDMMSAELKGIVNPSLKVQYEDTYRTLERLQTGEEKLFNFSLYVNARAKTKDKLELLTRQVESELNAMMIIPKTPYLKMQEAIQSIIPLAQDKLRIQRNIPSNALAACFPFTSSFLKLEKSGIMFGLNKDNNIPIILDPYKLQNYNGLVLGTSGGGKSIKFNEDVIIMDDGIIKSRKIGEVVNGLMRKRKTVKIDDESWGVVNPNILVYSFNSKFKAEWSPVTVAARKLSPKKLFTFITKSGREIQTTADHNMLILKAGNIQSIKSNQVKLNDVVPIPRKISFEGNIKKINLLDFLDGKLYVIGVNNTIKKNYSKIMKMLPIDDRFDKYLQRYRKNTNIQLNYFKKICKKIEVPFENLGKIFIIPKNGIEKMPADFKLTPEFMRLLGYFSSEGTTRHDMVVISNIDKNVRKDVANCFNKTGLNCFYSPTDLRSSSRVFIELLSKLGSFGKSGEKRAPSIVFGVDDELLKNYLKAYFEGDGTVSNRKVSATSKSKQLISDLSYLLLRFGIIARINKKHKTLNGKKFGPFYELTISGKPNVKKFQEIGFVTKLKNRKLSMVIARQDKTVENTNVDLIPTTEDSLREIDKLLFKGKKSFCADIVSGNYIPSRTRLQKIVFEMEKRLNELLMLKKVLERLDSLPNLQGLIKRGKDDKQLNSKLWKRIGSVWAVIKKNEVKSKTRIVFKMASIIEKRKININRVKKDLLDCFEVMEIGIRPFDSGTASFLKTNSMETDYTKIKEAVKYLNEQYGSFKLIEAEQKINKLKLLAYSDLFWDPIVEIKKSQNKDKYVYDLTIDNENFLAGFGGLFVHNSFFVKLYILRNLLKNVKTIIVDPQGEYVELCKTYGGQLIEISQESDTIINPLDLMDRDFGDKMLSLMDLFKIMCGELTEPQKNILDRCLLHIYAEKGIHPKDKDTWKREPPVLKDLYRALLQEKKTASRIEQMTYDALLNRIGIYAEGSFSFLNKKTNLDLNNKLICFNIVNMPAQVKPTIMYLILDFVHKKMQKDRERKLLVIDEAWTLLRYSEQANYLFELIKTSRKFGLGLVIITQEVNDLLARRAGKTILANCAWKLLLRQEPTVIKEISEQFNLNQEEQNYILTASTGEGLLFAMNDHIPTKIVASEKEYEIITTNPDDLREKQSKKSKDETNAVLSEEVQKLS
ncbi:MAG TPA: LAGLIDADG family homing endonuclease, partial [archaeon]|nr:LAGLIDADG family homing endonuclease [archaeon]